jgi:hypothetical protein
MKIKMTIPSAILGLVVFIVVALQSFGKINTGKWSGTAGVVVALAGSRTRLGDSRDRYIGRRCHHGLAGRRRADADNSQAVSPFPKFDPAVARFCNYLPVGVSTAGCLAY